MIKVMPLNNCMLPLNYPNVEIPKDDITAWQQRPWTRIWINKLHVAQVQDLECAPHGIYPTKFPVISRPTYNMDGMGAGAEIWRGPEDVVYRAGHFWTEVLEGDHTSWDIMLERGEITESYIAQGHHITISQFSHWNIWHAMPAIHVKGFIARHFNERSGKINIECIGDKIIEIHFRWCPEWEHWYDRVPFYSVPLWDDVDRWQQLGPAQGEGWEVIPDTVPGFVAPHRLGIMLCDDLKTAHNHARYKQYIG